MFRFFSTLERDTAPRIQGSCKRMFAEQLAMII